jgi:PDZ domain
MNKSNLAVSHRLTSAELSRLSPGADMRVERFEIRTAAPNWFTKRTMTLNVVTILSIVGLILASAAAVWAEDDKPEAKSSASSSAESSSKKNTNTKIEVHVVEEKSNDDSSNAPKRSSSRTFSAQSSNSESVDKAIDEVQNKLREIDLPEHLQNQALELLRKIPASGNVTLGLKNGKEGELHTYTFQTPNFFSATVSPELRSRLMKSIEKAIDEENLESEVAKRLMEKVKVAIDKAGKVGGQATAKFRIGIQLEVEGAKDDSDSENDSRKKELGIGVKEVFEDTPAAKAGLKAGDRILSANGKTIHATEALIDTVKARSLSNFGSVRKAKSEH